MTEVKLEILDTGMEEKGGSVVYTKATSTWVTLPARTLTPEFDFVGSNDAAKRLDAAGTRLTYVPNRIQSANAPRLTIQCRFDTEDTTAWGLLIDMGFTLGLKKIRGGLGTLGVLPDNESGEVYVIIKSLRPNENLSTANNKISCTLVLEVV